MKRIERKWMYERLDDTTKRPRIEFLNGMAQFIEHAKNQPDFRSNKGKIRCPCANCKNMKYVLESEVKSHLLRKGFRTDYYNWTSHGEPFPPDNVVKVSTNPYKDMVNDALRDNIDTIREEALNQVINNETPNPQVLAFFDMLKNAEKPLFEGSNVSVLQATSRLLNLKCEYNLPHKCVDSIASLIGDILPTNHSMSQNFYQTKKLLKALELPHQKIDVCPNGCMLYWGDDINKERCDKCDRDRYKKRKIDGKKRPRKVLIYFPIGPRLQRLYATKHVAEHMRWHSNFPRKSGTMAHPSDADAWKHFDSLHPEFAREPRNVRLGLCTDGFAPFGQFGKSYSCWPVMLTPYNLPPEMCMKKQFIFLSLIVPGPSNPKNNLDVYLQPLIHELKELWNTGLFTYDVSLKQNFDMKAALMWTINDFPAYGMLSGWGTSGEHACPYCMTRSKSFWLKNSRKMSWFDCHRQFLPKNHPFRKNRKYFRMDRKVENDEPPPRLGGEEIWECVKHMPTVVKSKEIEFKNLKGKREGWWKQSIFWELPYWKDLLIRHNLDVMHIEKNFFEQVINTVMDVPKKTTYGPRGKLDTVEICAPREEAKFVLKKNQKELLCNWVTNLKFPDGFASDLSRCVEKKLFILHGMKSHDCHVFMERLLPVALKYLIPKNEWNALTEISQFFRDLCASTIKIDDMIRLETNIPEILCKLEKIFPPSFFNSMEHLPVHLPYEAKVGGPVQYRWMYPFERFLNHLKKKIGNKAHVEGSICNAYLLEEISNFCSIYFEDHIDTKSKSLNLTSKESEDAIISELFRDHKGKPSGKCIKRFLDKDEYARAHNYILSNCEILHPYKDMYNHYIASTNNSGVFFSEWFRHQASSLNVNKSEVSLNEDLLYALSMGPSRQVNSWNRYIINGFKFRTEGDIEKASVNNGVCVGSTEGVDYFGTLEDVIELTYTGNLQSYSTTLFKCSWVDISQRGTIVDKTYKLVEVNLKRKTPKNIQEPFILAYQAQQCYYAPHPNTRRDRDDWLAAFKIKARSDVDAPVDESFFQENIANSEANLSSIEIDDDDDDDVNDDQINVDEIRKKNILEDKDEEEESESEMESEDDEVEEENEDESSDDDTNDDSDDSDYRFDV